MQHKNYESELKIQKLLSKNSGPFQVIKGINKMKNIIFLFSLPRSGSTLLQKILMTHKDITSVAEPWLLLPFLYAYKQEGSLAEYSHITCYVAFEDFIKNLPNGEKDYYQALREFAISLYKRYCKNGEKYFLDKTPRYYLIIPEIAKIFPSAKFIFLFRNPVQVFASIISTWGNNRLNKLYGNWIDIIKGPLLLSKGYNILRDKAYTLQFEKFIENPNKYLNEIFNYLELEPDFSVLDTFFQVDTKGRMGDPSGVKKYKTVSREPLNKWKKVFNTPLRKRMLLQYISRLDGEIFKTQGYNKEKLLSEIENLKINKFNFLQDSLDLTYVYLIRKLKLYIFFGKKVKWCKDLHLS